MKRGKSRSLVCISGLFGCLCLIGALGGCKGSPGKVTQIQASRASERVQTLKAHWRKVKAEEKRRIKRNQELSEESMAELKAFSELSHPTRGDPDPQVRGTCLRILAMSSFWSGREVFRRSLADPSRRCRWEALHGLRVKKDPRAVKDIIKLLKESSEFEIRLEAINVLSALHAGEAIPALVSIVTDLLEKNRCATCACLALRRLTGKQFSSDNYLAWRKWYEEEYVENGDRQRGSRPEGPGSP